MLNHYLDVFEGGLRTLVLQDAQGLRKLSRHDPLQVPDILACLQVDPFILDAKVENTVCDPLMNLSGLRWVR